MGTSFLVVCPVITSETVDTRLVQKKTCGMPAENEVVVDQGQRRRAVLGICLPEIV